MNSTFPPAGIGNTDLGRQMAHVERLSRSGEPGMPGKKPEDMSPEELHATLWQILKFRDSVAKTIEQTVRRFFQRSTLQELQF